MESATTFSSLPVSLQLKVLEQLDWTDSLQARLVCADWYEFINHVKPLTFLVADEAPGHPCVPIHRSDISGVVLPVLITSYIDKIGTLMVKDLKTPLPITSSTRMLIPPADKLVLAGGNSEANVQKLLRCYASSVRTLCLKSYCLGAIKPWKLSREVHWNQMTRLEINFNLLPGHLPYRRDRQPAETQRLQLQDGIKQHLITLGALLASVRLPNLRSFFLKLKTTNSTLPMTSHLLVLTKFSAGFEKFMKTHGPRITKMEVCLPCLDIMNSFKHTGARLKTLALCYSRDSDGKYDSTHRFRTDPRLVLSCFKNLVDLYLQPKSLNRPWWDCTPEDEQFYHGVTSMVLANNRQTLRSFDYFGGHFRTFVWLIPDLKLKSLKVLMVNVNANTFKLEHKLEQLTEFSINFDDASQPDWSPSFFRWVRYTMPALQDLQIKSWGSHLQPAGLELRTLVESSRTLRRILLRGWIEPISDEVEQWIESTDGRVEGKWLWEDGYMSEYEITIHRP